MSALAICKLFRLRLYSMRWFESMYNQLSVFLRRVSSCPIPTYWRVVVVDEQTAYIHYVPMLKPENTRIWRKGMNWTSWKLQRGELSACVPTHIFLLRKGAPWYWSGALGNLYSIGKLKVPLESSAAEKYRARYMVLGTQKWCVLCIWNDSFYNQLLDVSF